VTAPALDSHRQILFGDDFLQFSIPFTAAKSTASVANRFASSVFDCA
jgi:hypothetical protein